MDNAQSPLLPQRRLSMMSRDRHTSSISSDATEVDATELESLRQTYSRRSSMANFLQFRTRRRLGLLGWPSFIIVGQLIMLALAWGFLGAVFHNGQIPLPDGTAERIKRSPTLTTLVVTIIATIFSLFSAFLFTRALRSALIYYLATPRPLTMLSSMIEVAKGTFVFNTRQVKWMFVTALSSLAMSAMTAGWVTLLQPTVLTVSRDITGTELDLASPAFGQLLLQTWDFGNDEGVGGVGTTSGATLGPVVDASGISAASRLIGLPNTVNLNGMSYNVSTGGILPTGSNDMLGHKTTSNGTGRDFAGGILPVRFVIHGDYPNPAGFQRNHTMLQQGFTTSVSCQSVKGDLTKTRPSLSGNQFSEFIPDFDPVLHFNQTLQKWMWDTWCPDGSYTYNANFVTLQDVSNGGFVVGNMCPFQNMSTTNATGLDPSTHLIILNGVGDAYSFISPTVCSITALQTEVQVDYAASANVSRIISATKMVENPAKRDSSIGYYAAHIVSQRLSTTQNLWRNGFGDGIASVFRGDPDSVGGTADQKSAVLNSILEEYIKGITEFTGTFLREGYSADGSFPNNHIPQNMSRATTGYLVAETMGWSKQSAVGLVGLLPITAIALASIIVVVHAITIRERSYAEPMVSAGRGGTAEPFNPLNPLHLVVVSSLGGLQDTFTGTQGNNVQRSEKVRVRLADVHGKNMGLMAEDV